LGDLTRKIIYETTYNASNGMLNPTIPKPSWRIRARSHLWLDHTSRHAPSTH